MKSSIGIESTLEAYYEKRCMQIIGAIMRQHGINKIEVDAAELHSLPDVCWIDDKATRKTSIWLGKKR